MKKEDTERVITELKEANARLEGELAKKTAEAKDADRERQQLLYNAGLKVKELNCLYGLAELIAKYGDSLDNIFSEMVYLIPPAWQYPDITCARIIFKGREFKTDDFKPAEWRQSAGIEVYGEREGSVEVCILEERPQADEGPFLSDEKRLIKAIAERLARTAEHKMAQDDLVNAKKVIEENYKKLKELESLKDGLTHMIVHDLNNPLTVTSGNIELLKLYSKDNLSRNQRECLESALLAANELKRMIGDLLDVNKMEEGKIILNYEDFDLADTARQVVEQMKILAERDDKTLSLEDCDDNLHLEADKELVRRVIGNLIGNALKYTPDKGHVYVRASSADNDSLCISVRDTGSGIPQDYLNRVFDKFVRVESEKVKTGRGLGLAFCKMAVEAHGGRIWVESEPGSGSNFKFLLPRKPKA